MMERWKVFYSGNYIRYPFFGLINHYYSTFLFLTFLPVLTHEMTFLPSKPNNLSKLLSLHSKFYISRLCESLLLSRRRLSFSSNIGDFLATLVLSQQHYAFLFIFFQYLSISNFCLAFSFGYFTNFVSLGLFGYFTK